MLTLTNVSGSDLDTYRWHGPIVADGDRFDLDAEVVEHVADATVIETPDGERLALPHAHWTVAGDDVSETAADVLKRVGGDPDRARAELTAEEAGRNRAGLTRDLRRIIEQADAPSAPTMQPATATADNPMGE